MNATPRHLQCRRASPHIDSDGRSRNDPEFESGVIMRILFFAFLMILINLGVARAQSDPYYQEAERQFMGLALEYRLYLQLIMSSIGHWPSVPDSRYSRRLHDSIRGYQAQRGETATGILTRDQLEDVLVRGKRVLDGWSLREIRHPERNVTLWVPNGLDLGANRTPEGVFVKEPRNRFRLSFNLKRSVNLAEAYRANLAEMRRSGDQIDYDVLRPDFFVIHGTQGSGKFHRYLRYHVDREGIIGFDASWSSDEAPIYGDRLITIISGSLRASITGAPFPPGRPIALPWDASPPPVAAAPAPSPTVSPPAQPEAKKEEKGPSSGTGFFVSWSGHILTNQHVVDSCGEISVRGENGVTRATLLAADKTNDLALLKLEKTPSEAKVAAFKPGVRIGEPVAVFGFPLAQVLAKSGNFTLGNVTALAGLRDDTRHIQISAPVQPGNSGGPLVDEAGRVVGVVSSKLDSLKTALLSGDIPQNVNFAIKSMVAMTFLDAQRIVYVTGEDSKPLPPADLAEKARAMSVFVSCR